jgi:hypothetical protein
MPREEDHNHRSSSFVLALDVWKKVPMLTQTLWWSGNVYLAILLVRAIAGRFFTKYLIFYIYLSHVLLLMLLRFFFYLLGPNVYRTFYWYTQFFSVAIGYCVIWQIYQQALVAYPGTLRMARGIVLSIFIGVVAKVLVNGLTGPVWGPIDTVVDLERNLRAVQAVLLVVVIAVIIYYMIPIGRNLRGIILGYGFFLGTGVIAMTLRSLLGDSFQLWWRYSQSIAWLATLVIWSATLWSYHPNPVPEADVGIERDYEWLSAQTARAVARARGHLLGGVR